MTSDLPSTRTLPSADTSDLEQMSVISVADLDRIEERVDELLTTVLPARWYQANTNPVEETVYGDLVDCCGLTHEHLPGGGVEWSPIHIPTATPEEMEVNYEQYVGSVVTDWIFGADDEGLADGKLGLDVHVFYEEPFELLMKETSSDGSSGYEAFLVTEGGYHGFTPDTSDQFYSRFFRPAVSFQCGGRGHQVHMGNSRWVSDYAGCLAEAEHLAEQYPLPDHLGEVRQLVSQPKSRVDQETISEGYAGL